MLAYFSSDTKVIQCKKIESNECRTDITLMNNAKKRELEYNVLEFTVIVKKLININSRLWP